MKCVYTYIYHKSATRLLTLFALQTFPRWERRESESLNPLRARNIESKRVHESQRSYESNGKLSDSNSPNENTFLSSRQLSFSFSPGFRVQPVVLKSYLSIYKNTQPYHAKEQPIDCCNQRSITQRA